MFICSFLKVDLQAVGGEEVRVSMRALAVGTTLHLLETKEWMVLNLDAEVVPGKMMSKRTGVKRLSLINGLIGDG
jgi:hypothetical protein